MIITLTGNLLAERTLTFPNWFPGKTKRATSETFQVGGKGINVAKMLRRIDAATTAWCFTGGAAGAECAEWLAAQGIPHRTFPTTAPTRTGLVVRSENQAETTFLGPDRAPDAEALHACAQALDAARGGKALLALCGSFPGWDSAHAEPLRAAIARWAETGALVGDSYGPPLTWLVQRPVALIKINRQEFDGLFPLSERNRSVPERLDEIRNRWAPRQWIVTDGGGPLCYAAVDTKAVRVQPPIVQEVSATGSGDVLFACVLRALFDQNLTLADAIAYAIPYAAANAAHPGVAEFELNNLPAPGSFAP